MTIGCYDGFEVIPLPALFLAIATAVRSHCGSGCDLLCLTFDGFFDVGAIHHGTGGSGRRKSFLGG